MGVDVITDEIISPTDIADERETQEAEPVRDLTSEEEKIKENISKELALITVDTLANLEPSHWTKVSEEMVDFLSALPEWDETMINALDKVFTTSYDRITKEGSQEDADQFANMWNGWVSEALINKTVNKLDLKLKRSPKMDQKGIDGLLVFANKKRNIYLHFSVKSSRNEMAGVCLQPITSEVGEFDTMTPVFGSEMDMRMEHFLNYDKFEEHQSGRISRFVVNNTRYLHKDFKRRNEKNGIDNNHRAYALIVLAGVGMKGENNEKLRGWKETMSMAQDGWDPAKGQPLVEAVRKSILFDLAPEAEKENHRVQ